MNPYREPGKPSSRLREFFVNRVSSVTWSRVAVTLAAVLVAGIMYAGRPGTSSLRINGVMWWDGTNAMHAIDVKAPEYGCYGDGTHDDTACIQAAISAAGAKLPVYFPPGNYKYSSTLTLQSGTKLWGSGVNSDPGQGTGSSTLTRTANVIGLQGIGVSILSSGNHLQDIEIKDMVLDGGGFASDLLQFKYVSQLLLERNFVGNSTAHDLFLGEVYDSRLINNVFESGGTSDGVTPMIEIISNGVTTYECSNHIHFISNRLEAFPGVGLQTTGTCSNRLFLVANKIEGNASNKPAVIFNGVTDLDLNGLDVVQQGSAGSTITEMMQINNSYAIRGRIWFSHHGTIGVDAAALNRYLNLNTDVKGDLDIQIDDPNYASITDSVLVKQTSCDFMNVRGFPFDAGGTWTKELTDQNVTVNQQIQQIGSNPYIVQQPWAALASTGKYYLGRLITNGGTGTFWRFVTGLDGGGEQASMSINSLNGIVEFPASSTKIDGSLTLAGGLTASGAVANDFSGGTGAFKTSTGAGTFGGSSNTFTNGATMSGTLAVNGGATATGSTAIDFSGNTGLFKTTTGAGTFGNSTSTFSGTLQTNGQLIANSAVRVGRLAVADTTFTAVAGVSIIAYTSITAPRSGTVSVSTGNAANPEIFIIKDESGSASGTNTITVSPSSGLIDGAASKVCVNAAFGSCRVYCQGTNCFTW